MFVFPGNGRLVDVALRGATSRSLTDKLYKKPKYNSLTRSERILLAS
jgi:hypothetical protein